MNDIKIYCPGCTNHCQYPNACCVIGMGHFAAVTPSEDKKEKLKNKNEEKK